MLEGTSWVLLHASYLAACRLDRVEGAAGWALGGAGDMPGRTFWSPFSVWTPLRVETGPFPSLRSLRALEWHSLLTSVPPRCDWHRADPKPGTRTDLTCMHEPFLQCEMLAAHAHELRADLE